MTELDQLDLTPEELQQLRDDGLIDPGWVPGMDQTEGDTVDDEEIDSPLAGELMDTDMSGGVPASVSSPLSTIEDGQGLLHAYEQESPAIHDPTIKRFSDIALRWLPTNDDQLKEAKTQAQRAADELAGLRAAADKAAAGFPWDTFAAEMLSAKPSFGFSAALGQTLKATNAEKARLQKVARDLGITEAEATAQRATQTERSEMERVRSGADLAQAAAQMQRYSTLYNKTAKDTNSAFGKKMADLGVDIRTPEGQKAARRLWVLEQAKSDPAALQTLLANPNLDPFSPEFAEKVAQATVTKLGVKEAAAAAKEKRAESREERAAKAADAALEASHLQIKRTKQLIEQAGKGGISGGKVPAEIQRQQLALRAMGPGLNAYEEAIEAVDPRSLDQLSPAKQAKVKSILADLIISWKEAAALGALSGPDVSLIERALTDPFTAKGAWYGKKGLKEQLTQARASINRRAKSLEDQYGAHMDEAIPPAAPAGGGNASKEVRRQTKDGRVGIFNADTKQFIRWE